MTVFGLGPQEIYVAGERGVLRRSRDRGQTWEPVPTGVVQTIRALRGTGGTLWAAAWDGLVLRYDGQRVDRLWTQQREWLWDLWAGPEGIYTVGQRGLVLVRPAAEKRWLPFRTTPPNDLTSIWGTNAGILYTVGDAGLVLRSQDGGRHWEREESADLKGVRVRLHRVRGTQRGDLYIVGAQGVLFHRRLPAKP
ncbi:MAG: hypothetical protein RMK29_10195 [Myxococcales bacterium]|nr:hypothetical protein [Myxococcota bacterium]MDW8282073.1 hypothetical protein [Myxococcales bacterium]